MRIVDYLLSHESIIISVTILLVILNIIYNYNSPYRALIGSILIYLFYFMMSKHSKEVKKVLLVASLLFIIGGILLESIIIKKLEIVTYKFPLPNTNIPGWLVGAYLAFVIGAYHALSIANTIVNVE